MKIPGLYKKLVHEIEFGVAHIPAPPDIPLLLRPYIRQILPRALTLATQIGTRVMRGD